MNREIAQKWVAALRSGRYAPGTDYLCRGGRYTVTGVLCELAFRADVFGQHSIELDATGGRGPVAFNGSVRVVPPAVEKWAGIVLASHGALRYLHGRGLSFEAVSYTHLTLPTKRIV